MIAFIIIISVVIAIATSIVTINSVKKHRHNVVFATSKKRKAISELNQKYSFSNPRTSWNYMFGCQNLNKYRKMDNQELESLFFERYYYDVLNSLKELVINQRKYSDYKAEYDAIIQEPTIIPEKIKLNPKIYKRYENDIISPLKKKITNELKIKMAYEYTSPAGRNHYESAPHYLNYKNVDESTVYTFTQKYDPSLREQEQYKTVGGAIVPNDCSKAMISKCIRKQGEQEFARKHDYYVTLHVEISVLNKLVYYFVFLNRYNGRKFQLYDFQKTADEQLVKKVLGLKRLLDDIYYLEDPEKIINSLNLVRETATETSNFHLDMKDITYEMVKELNYKLNMSFRCDLSGDICIDRAQIGLAEDINAYLEENPNSVFINTFDWIQKTIDDINVNSKNKVAALYSSVISKSNERCNFYFTEYLEIKINIDIDVDRMIITTSPHYLYFGNEVTRTEAKDLVFDKTLFLACDSFLKDVKSINEYYSNKFSTLVKKLIPLRERHKDNDRIKFLYSDSIENSEEWMQHFNLRPDVEPMVLDYLEEGSLVCNEKLSSIMRHYQKYAFDWANRLVTNQLSGILADDMGLGKTLEIISVLNADDTNLPNLIVCPVSLLHNWENEFHKWCPEEKVVLQRSFNTRLFDEEINFQSKINYIVSYDFMIHHADKLKNYRFNYLILDEAQYIKNESTARSKHAKMLIANHRFALTGTPLENKEDDLINIFDFVMPSLNTQYKLKYLSRSVKREYIAPFLLRRRKTDVLDELPEKNTIIVELDMSEKQKSFYDTYKANHSDENDKYLELLALLTKLRQICVCPQMVSPTYNSDSVKLDYMFELIEQIIESNESVLIYSFFASVFGIVEPLMKRKNVKYVRLDGSVSPDDRAAIIDKFDNEDDIHCFLISLKAGGVGLNLTKANNVIFLDPWWNIAVENQASDRTHRIGQTKQVTIYRLICKDTIEEKVLDIQKEKLDLINFFVESQGDDPLGKLTIDMMRDILK